MVIRLGTTTIGLVVSTAVNMFVLPPDYTSHITENMMAIRKRLAAKIEKVFYTVTAEQPTAATNALKSTDVVYKKIRQTETLIQFQKEEAKYHPLTWDRISSLRKCPRYKSRTVKSARTFTTPNIRCT